MLSSSCFESLQAIPFIIKACEMNEEKMVQRKDLMSEWLTHEYAVIVVLPCHATVVFHSLSDICTTDTCPRRWREKFQCENLKFSNQIESSINFSSYLLMLKINFVSSFSFDSVDPSTRLSVKDLFQTRTVVTDQRAGKLSAREFSLRERGNFPGWNICQFSLSEFSDVCQSKFRYQRAHFHERLTLERYEIREIERCEIKFMSRHYHFVEIWKVVEWKNENENHHQRSLILQLLILLPRGSAQ